MRARTLAAAAAAGLVLLSGCSTDPRAEIRGTVEDITLDANGRDADAVRAGVEELLRQLDEAVRSGDLSAEEASQIAALAVRLRDAAGLLDPPEPTPAPTTARPTPMTASPTPSLTPSPTPTEEPEPTQEPEPTEEPDDEPPVVVDPTLSPAAQGQPVSPSPTP